MSEPTLKILTKEEILSHSDRPTKDVSVDEWGGVVRIRALSAYEQSEHQSALMRVETDGRGKVSTRMDMTGSDIRLVSMGVINEDGRRMFTYDELKELPAGPINMLADEIRELSGMNVTREEARGN